ncbi:hypothetical protein GOV14_04420 [Candidatus Pacearchaeota archaeon]|nr:hypothetical protein [Candidatus Pacearchaeota archaeon]
MVAILLSVVSIAVTISTVNTKMIPRFSNLNLPDEDSGRVSLRISPTPEGFGAG